MSLYRQIAGESVGLFLEAVEAEQTNGGGGGGFSTGGEFHLLPPIALPAPIDQVFYDPGIPVSSPVAIDNSGNLTRKDELVTTVIPTTDAGNGIPVSPTNQETVTTTVPTTATPGPTAKQNYFPLITLGALFYTMVSGESILGKYRNVAFLGGLGALFYQLSQIEKKQAATPIT